jgi:hypothetical protein
MNHRFVILVPCALVEAGQHNIAFTVKDMRQMIRVHACDDEKAANSAERLGAETCATVVQELRAFVAENSRIWSYPNSSVAATGVFGRQHVWEKLNRLALRRTMRNIRRNARYERHLGAGGAMLALWIGLGHLRATP